MVSVLSMLAIIFMMAFLVETLVEAVFGLPFDKIPILTPWKWTLTYVALAVGVVGAFIYHFDLLNLMSTFLATPVSETNTIPTTWYGITLTGLAVGRGSNYIHDLVKKFFVKEPLK